MDQFTMFMRYAMMIVTGILIQKGYIDSSLTEPVIGLGIFLGGIAWKKWEDYKKSPKDKKV